MKRAKTVLVMIAAFAVGMAGTAWSDYVDEIEVSGKATGQVKVTFGDLNLANEQGAEALYRRLQRASKIVCDISGSEKTRLAEVTAETKLCYDATLSGSVERINNDLVTVIHAGR